jgi:hypothetical protein
MLLDAGYRESHLSLAETLACAGKQQRERRCVGRNNLISHSAAGKMPELVVSTVTSARTGVILRFHSAIPSR